MNSLKIPATDDSDSSDNDNNQWDASQIPSHEIVKPTPIVKPTNISLLQSCVKQPLTTIFEKKPQASKKRKSPNPKNTVKIDTAFRTTPIAKTNIPTSVCVSIATPQQPNNATPPPHTWNGVRVFLEGADMLDVLANRKQLLALCDRALDILVYPKNGFSSGMQCSHCVYAEHQVTNISDFLACRMFQIGDNLQNVFVLCWSELQPFQAPTVSCVAKLYHKNTQLMMDVLHFSLCVGKRMIC